MIFFNAEAFMDEAIRSVLQQDYENLELVLVDDGSTDSSRRIAESYAARHHDRVRVVEHAGRQRRGMGSSRNRGVAASSGDVVCFLDADDVWSPDHVFEQVRLLLRFPDVDVVCGIACTWRSWASPAEVNSWSPLPFAPGTVVPVPRMLTATLQWGALATPICSVMARTALVRRIGGVDEGFTSMYEDQTLLARLWLAGPVVVSGARTAYYRQHRDSACAAAERLDPNHPGHPARGREIWLQWLRQHPNVAGPDVDPELRHALDTAVRDARRSTRRRRRDRVLAKIDRLAPRAVGAARRATASGVAIAAQVFAAGRTHRRSGPGRGPAAWPADFFSRHRANITGDVLTIGDVPTMPSGPALTSDRSAGDRPRHALQSALAESADTVVAVLDEAALPLGEELADVAAHVRRVLRPGGVLLAVVRVDLGAESSPAGADWARRARQIGNAFTASFGVDCVELYPGARGVALDLSTPRLDDAVGCLRPPAATERLFAVRAFVPA
jgi:GT2 family glycosyltransferase